MAELKNLIVEGDSRLIGDTNAGKITASSIVKSGGTSSQFLKADGSVDSNNYATTSQIPTVNNATLTIQKNGTTVNSFTANASSNVTANITVPTKTSELTNDSGYTTNTGTVTAVALGSQQYDPSGGVVLLPSYPSVSNATITVKQTGLSDQTFTLNGSSTTITLADTTYSSKTAASGGTDVSLCTTGEKYTWNNKSTVPTNHASQSDTYGTGTTSNYGHVKLATGDMNGASDVNGVACSKNHTHSQYAGTGHTHTTTIAAGTSGDTSQITLANGGKYKISVGGGTPCVFTMPAGASSDIYYVTYGTTTYDECKTAFDAGKVLVCKMADEYEEDEMLMVGTYKWEGGIFTFSSFNGTGKQLCYVTLDNSNWSTLEYISLEDTSNKVSSITGSNISSTTYYPSNGAITSYVAGAVAGRYQCTKKSSTGNISAVYCANGNIICVPTNSSTFTGTFVMTLDNFYSAFMKSIGGYTSIKGANSAANKVIELSGVMANSTIIKMHSGGTGNCTKYQFSYLSTTGSAGAPSNFTYGSSSSGCRIYVANGSDVTITLV